MSTEQVEEVDIWAIVEVMGHNRFIGRVTEQVIAGHGFVRVDVPETDSTQSFTKLLGPQSIYAVTPVSEEVARAMNAKSPHTPVSVYELTPRLTTQVHAAMLNDDEEPF